MTESEKKTSLQSISEEKAEVDAVIMEALKLGHASLHFEIADGKVVSGGMEKKFKFR